MAKPPIGSVILPERYQSSAAKEASVASELRKPRPKNMDRWIKRRTSSEIR